MIDKNIKQNHMIDPAKGVLSYHLEKSLDICQAVGVTVTEEAKRELESEEYGFVVLN